MKKRIGLVAVLVMFIVLLTGCGSTKTASAPVENAQPVTNQTSTAIISDAAAEPVSDLPDILPEDQWDETLNDEDYAREAALYEANYDSQNGAYFYGGNVEVGDVIYFGYYEQDNDENDGREPIEWMVLDKQDGRALLLSNYALEVKKFHEAWEAVTWETCSLRDWLNVYFIEMAFDPAEQEMIPEVTLRNDAAIYNDVHLSKDTVDRIFCLSYDELDHYFGIQEQAWEDETRPMRCPLNNYVRARGANKFEGNVHPIESDYSQWWTRTPWIDGYESAYCVTDYGIVGSIGVNSTGRCVRPALWINLNP